MVHKWGFSEEDAYGGSGFDTSRLDDCHNRHLHRAAKQLLLLNRGGCLPRVQAFVREIGSSARMYAVTLLEMLATSGEREEPMRGN